MDPGVVAVFREYISHCIPTDILPDIILVTTRIGEQEYDAALGMRAFLRLLGEYVVRLVGAPMELGQELLVTMDNYLRWKRGKGMMGVRVDAVVVVEGLVGVVCLFVSTTSFRVSLK